ncbi:MAG: hypothetical protein ACPGSD_06825 [Flavobacteriales bacterium]
MKSIFIFLSFFLIKSVKAQRITKDKLFFEGGLSHNLFHIFATNDDHKLLINDPIALTFNIDANYTIHNKFAIGLRYIYDTGSEKENKPRNEVIQTINGVEYDATALSGFNRNGFGINLYYAMHKMNMPFASKIGLHLLVLNINSDVNYFKRSSIPIENWYQTKYELIESEELDDRIVFLGASYTEQIFFNRKSNLYLLYGINTNMILKDLPQSITSESVISNIQSTTSAKLAMGFTLGLGFIL